MKVRILALAFTVAMFSLLTVVTASAQLEGRIKATIPFDFIVGDKVMPAGDYTIERVQPSDGELILIRSDDNANHVIVDANGAYTANAPKDTELLFDRIGDKSFLRDLFLSGENTGCEILKSREERNLLRGRSVSAEAVTVPVGTAQRH